MKRVKKRIFSGAVCEQIVYNVSERAADIKTARPVRPRFNDEEERAKFNLERSRRAHYRKVQANFGPSSLYSTLTMDIEHEVHTFEEADRIRCNYRDRLLYDYPEGRLMIYMGRGKSTKKIHFHMISEGIPEEAIREKWGMGDIIDIAPLREHNYDKNGVDHGQDYESLANYLFNHWTPDQGTKKRWREGGEFVKPEEESAKPVQRKYSEGRPPVMKGYILVECYRTPYDLYYYKYVKTPPPDMRRQRKKNA